MTVNKEPLQFLPLERWGELEKLIEDDWPRGISALAALQTQKEIVKLGLGYGFKVYCPYYGEPNNGMVALNKKGPFNEIIIYSPPHSIEKLENSLKTTSLVDWKNSLAIPFLPKDLFNCMERVAPNVNIEIESEIDHPPHHVVLLDKEAPLFENIKYSDDITFRVLEEEHVDIIDNAWPNRYEGSRWLFELLIKAKFGYGLLKDNDIVSCVFINEVGSLCHVFTFENYRNKGYGSILLKLVCNEQLKRKKHTFGYCERGNPALNVYKKLGFEVLHDIQWCFTNPK